MAATTLLPYPLLPDFPEFVEEKVVLPTPPPRRKEGKGRMKSQGQLNVPIRGYLYSY